MSLPRAVIKPDQALKRLPEQSQDALKGKAFNAIDRKALNVTGPSEHNETAVPAKVEDGER